MHHESVIGPFRFQIVELIQCSVITLFPSPNKEFTEWPLLGHDAAPSASSSNSQKLSSLAFEFPAPFHFKMVLIFQSLVYKGDGLLPRG
jgi:hypothetical protein